MTKEELQILIVLLTKILNNTTNQEERTNYKLTLYSLHIKLSRFK